MMDQMVKEKMMTKFEEMGLDKETIDEDMIMILDDLRMDMRKIMQMLEDKGMDDDQIMDTMEKIGDVIMDKEMWM